MRVLHFFLGVFPSRWAYMVPQCYSITDAGFAIASLHWISWGLVKPLLQSAKISKINSPALLHPDLVLSPGEFALGISSNWLHLVVFFPCWFKSGGWQARLIHILYTHHVHISPLGLKWFTVLCLPLPNSSSPRKSLD